MGQFRGAQDDFIGEMTGAQREEERSERAPLGVD